MKAVLPVGSLFLAVTLISPASAQVTSGTIAGSIVDPQGRRVPGATIVVISESRGTRLTPVVTNADGDFVLPNLTADTYIVEVTMPGFKALRREHVPVSGGERVPLGELTLEVGGASETVQVTAERALIQAQSGERSFTITPVEVESLPIAGRNFASLTALSPGANGTARIGGGGMNNIMMDGVSVVDTGSNGQMLNLNPEAIAEVKVLTSGYQAEYGRSSGLQITAVTKSGTNRFHGSLYDLKRNSDWNANSWANKQNGVAKTVSKQDDWGYTIAGPIGKPGRSNKLFFFYGHEYSPRQAGNSVNRFRVPTELERKGDFSQTLDNNGALFNTIRDYTLGSANCTATATATCFRDGNALGRIPTDRLYGPGMAILNNLWPAPNHVQRPGENYNYEVLTPVTDTLTHQPSVRFDYQASAALRLTVKFNGQNQGRALTPGSLPGYNDTQRISGAQWISTWATTVGYTLNPTTFVEATYGRAKNFLASVLMTDVSNINNVGLGNLPILYPDGRIVDPRYFNFRALSKSGSPYFASGRIWLPPNFAWGTRIGCATTNNGGVSAPCPPNLQFPGALNTNVTQDVSIGLTKIKSGHTFKTGFYLNHSYKAQNINLALGALPFNGFMNFANDVNNPLDSGFGYANAALGILSVYQQQSKFVEGSYIYNNREWFVQDNWKVNRRLTLDVGLRLVNQQPQYDQFQQSSNFFIDRWSAAKAPLLYVPGCVGGSYPCSTANRQAMDPRDQRLLGPGSAIYIGQIVPGTGEPLQAVIQSGQGISKYGYTWPTVAIAPRAGVAFDLTGQQRIVFRGGAGLFFDRPAGGSVQNSSSNPPYSTGVTIRSVLVSDLAKGAGQGPSVPSQLIVYKYDDKNLPSSVQWNGGMQLVLPWSSFLDVSYVGMHEFAVLPITGGGSIGVNVNAVDIGAAFRPENRDPSLADSATPGATALPTDMLRSIRGYASISQYQGLSWRTFHSIQASLQRRFNKGVSAGLNWTITLADNGMTSMPQPRLQHNADGTWYTRPDQADFEALNKDLGTAVHQLKANFVWSLPRPRVGSNLLTRTAAIVASDWQISGVFTADSGSGYSIGYTYQNGGGNVNLTGSPDYPAKIRIVGDPGSGCSSNQYRQFNTETFAGPVAPSLGLESGRNYLTGCGNHIMDLAIARNFEFGRGRRAQLRVDLFNAFNTVIFTGVATTVQFNSPTDQTVRNPQYSADGPILPARLLPNNAGFGAVTGAAAPRSVQAQLRFSF